MNNYYLIIQHSMQLLEDLNGVIRELNVKPVETDYLSWNDLNLSLKMKTASYDFYINVT